MGYEKSGEKWGREKAKDIGPLRVMKEVAQRTNEVRIVKEWRGPMGSVLCVLVWVWRSNTGKQGVEASSFTSWCGRLWNVSLFPLGEEGGGGTDQHLSQSIHYTSVMIQDHRQTLVLICLSLLWDYSGTFSLKIFTFKSKPLDGNRFLFSQMGVNFMALVQHTFPIHKYLKF